MFWYVTKSLVFVIVFYAVVKLFKVLVAMAMSNGFLEKETFEKEGIESGITGKEFLDYLIEKVGVDGYSVVRVSESKDAVNKALVEALPENDYDKISGDEIILTDSSFETINFGKITNIMAIITDIKWYENRVFRALKNYYVDMKSVLLMSLFIIPLGLIKNEWFGINVLNIGIIMLGILCVLGLIVRLLEVYTNIRVIKYVEQSGFFTYKEMRRIKHMKWLTTLNDVIFSIILPLSDIYFMLYYLLIKKAEGAKELWHVADKIDEEGAE